MNIAVTGGTGTLGARVVAELARRGHDVRALSRTAPAVLPAGVRHHTVDLTTGAGLDDALRGVDVVVDASNGPPNGADDVLVGGTRRLLVAERDAGVRHHVGVSIVGIEDVPMGYYRTKVAQEEEIVRGGVPWTILRATQFHDLVAMLFGATGRYRMLPGFRALLQPVAVDDVALAVADLAEGGPRLGREEIAGPEVIELRDLARTWRAHTGRRAWVVRGRLPGGLGRALRRGGLTDPDARLRGRTTFATWLERAA